MMVLKGIIIILSICSECKQDSCSDLSLLVISLANTSKFLTQLKHFCLEKYGIRVLKGGNQNGGSLNILLWSLEPHYVTTWSQ